MPTISKTELKQLFVEDEIKNVIDYLLEITESLELQELHNAVILQSAKFLKSEQNIKRGVIPFKDKTLIENKIVRNLSKIIDELPDKAFNNTDKTRVDRKDKKVNLFVFYAREDLRYYDELKLNIAGLIRNGKISLFDNSILPGQEWKKVHLQQLEYADIILLLISSSFLASDFSYGDIIMEKHKRAEAIVIPIILRPCAWKVTAFSHLKALPYNGKPISTWEYQDDAYVEIAQSINNIINPISQIKDGERKGDSLTFTEFNSRNEGLTSFPTYVFKNKDLKVIDLSNNNITEIPDDISQLENLEVLNLKDNAITKISKEITKLRNLTQLNLTGNRIKYLHEQINFSEFKNLKDLYLVNNDIKFLDKSVIIGSLETLQISGNPIENIPIEVYERRGNIIDSIRSYFNELSEGEGKFYEAKLILVGAGGAGKTSLLRKIKNPQCSLPKPNETTRGINIENFTFPYAQNKSITFNANIWDFGGQEIYHATHQFFLTQRSLYILVLDNRKEDDDIDYWLSVINLLSNGSPVIIAVNEMEDRKRDINLSTLRKYYPSILNNFHTNLSNNRGLETLVTAIKEEIGLLEHIGKPLPEKWIEVRKALESDDRNHINYERYIEICSELGINEETQALSISRFLHDLGIILHFQEDEVLANLIVLKTTWVTNAIYKVLEDEKVINNNGKFTEADLDKYWHSKEYPLTKRKELLRFMKKFGLCYEIGNSKTYISPQLLPAEKPDYNWDELVDNYQKNKLCFKYKYIFMPKGIVRRLVSQLNKYIYKLNGKDLVWKNGVVFNRNDTVVEVFENLYGGRKDITIRLIGKEKKEFLAIIRDSLSTIHNSYRGKLQYKELIPCCCSECVKEEEPHFFDNEVLKKALSKDVKEVQCQVSFENISITELINGVEPEYNNKVGKKIFFSYSRKDKEYRDELEKHLSNVKRNYNVKTWYDHEILPGDEWEKEIMDSLNTADIILLMVSPEFNYSDYCFKELQIALKRHENKQAVVVPIIVSPCDWEDTEFAKLNALPTGAKPIDHWPLKNDAYLDIVNNLKRIVATS